MLHIITEIPVALQLEFKFGNSLMTWGGNSVIYDLFTCDVNFPVCRYYLGCQCDITNAKKFYEILKYLVQILPTPLNLYVLKSAYFIFSAVLSCSVLFKRVAWWEYWTWLMAQFWGWYQQIKNFLHKSKRIMHMQLRIYQLLCECNGTQAHNHLVLKKTPNHFAKLTSWSKKLSVCL